MSSLGALWEDHDWDGALPQWLGMVVLHGAGSSSGRDCPGQQSPGRVRTSAGPFLSPVIGGVRKKVTEQGEACHSGMAKLFLKKYFIDIL